MRATCLQHRDHQQHPAEILGDTWFVHILYTDFDQERAVIDWLAQNITGRYTAYEGHSLFYFEIEQDAMMFYMRFS